MKILKQFAYALFLGVLTLNFSACSEDESVKPGPGPDPQDPEMVKTYKACINDYVDLTILPTYKSLKEESVTLSKAVKAFADAPTQANLDAACNQWVKTRVPWEQSEAFLFGPIANQQIDPHLDSWPLNQVSITAILGSSLDWENEDGSSMGANTLGFHTLEYLLFKDGKHRQVSELINGENAIIEDQKGAAKTYPKKNYFGYIKVVSQVLSNDALMVYALWMGSDNLSKEDAARAEELEFPDYTAKGYQARFRNPNINDQSFPNHQACLFQIIDSSVDIATEVADAKMGEPYDAGDVFGVESWYSFNSFTDYEDNIISIENAFMGGPEKTRKEASSLYTIIKAADAKKADAVKAQIQACRDALGSIVGTFRDIVLAKKEGKKSVEVEAAIKKIGELSGMLEELKPLVKEI